MSIDLEEDRRSRRREQRGWYFYDWAASAFSTTVVAVFLGPYLTSIVQAAAAAGQSVTVFGLIEVTPESYFPYVISISVLLQVLVMPVVGALADHLDGGTHPRDPPHDRRVVAGESRGFPPRRRRHPAR